MKSLASLVAIAAIAMPVSFTQPSNAADYCHTDDDGDYICIQSVFGNRSNRGIVYTMNGYVRGTRINCYNYNYRPTSIAAVACWSFNAIQSEPENMPEITEVPESIKGIMTGDGFIPEDKAIDLDKVRNAMPSEMK